jgi:transcriptional regulator with XRE-family HTH domain
VGCVKCVEFETRLNLVQPSWFDDVATILALATGVLYSLIRLLLDVATTSRREQAKLQAEVLVLDLARRMGTTQSVIARLEAGGSKPSMTTLERVAHALDVDLRFDFEKRVAV